jgi:hypothetical protein
MFIKCYKFPPPNSLARAKRISKIKEEIIIEFILTQEIKEVDKFSNTLNTIN